MARKIWRVIKSSFDNLYEVNASRSAHEVGLDVGYLVGAVGSR